MKYKKLTLVFLVILVLLSIPVISKASLEVENNGEIVSLPDLPIDINNPNLHYVVAYNYYGYHFLYYEGNEFDRIEFWPNGDSPDVVVFLKEDGSIIDSKNGDSIYLYDYNSKNGVWGSPRPWGGLSGTGVKVFYSSENVYNEDGTVFFRRTPLGIVGEALETTPMEGVLMEIVKILPLILVLVVSLLGLRKCLKTLSTLLRQA